jgi:hypothetical protein
MIGYVATRKSPVFRNRDHSGLFLYTWCFNGGMWVGERVRVFYFFLFFL